MSGFVLLLLGVATFFLLAAWRGNLHSVFTALFSPQGNTK